MLKALSARVECPHCGTPHIVDRNGDGFPDLDLVPCRGSDTCEARLCESCRVMCISCGQWCCEEHVSRRIADRHPLCDVCVNDEEPAECQCQNVTGRWDLEETWDARGCALHGK